MITNELRLYLKGKVTSRWQDHEDLISQATLDIHNYVSKHSSTLPKSWFSISSEIPNRDEEHFIRLSYVILKRRIADLYRNDNKEVVLTSDIYNETLKSKEPSLEKRAVLNQMLDICIKQIAQSSINDRKILALMVEKGEDKALIPKERQQIRRLRIRLKKRILDELGSSASNLLKELDNESEYE